MDDLQLKVLEIVKRHNGEYSWYQLDRALSVSGVQHAGNLMQVLRTLVADGYIVTTAGPNTAQPLYSIGDRGEVALSDATRSTPEDKSS
jgi:DNA-binding PadR family transcriptional regulator